MASVITTAFENWKAQEAASGKAVLLDEFVFANVPNLDPTQPIDRNEKLPLANQIVHRQAVNKAGLASENAVAYSVTLGAEVGNFDFNWIGLLNKASGTVAMITHAPTQKKLKNQNGQQGNVLTRSFILEFQGAAEETQIKTSAETWQIDFTARLSGIDEMQRLINVDSYGAAAFFDESFEVTRSGEQFTVKKGLAYVGGLRGLLEQNQILNGLRNTKVYADFSYQGNIVSQWRTVIKITVAATLANYVDAAGFTHQVFAIASIDASGNVKDLRPLGALSDQELSALETRFKLDLSKKIDKANITHQTGNSTELVASQQLVTTEAGKKASKEELNNGLALKFDKTSVAQSTGSSTTQVMSQVAQTKFFTPKSTYDVAADGEAKIKSPSGLYFSFSYGGYAGAKDSNGAVIWQFDPSGILTHGVIPVSKLSGLSQVSGTSESAVMSQGACSREFAPRSSFSITGSEPRINGMSRYLFVSSGGYSGVKNNSNVPMWEFDPTGTLVSGTIPAQRVSGLQQLGVGQSWKDVKSARSLGVVYVNSTGKPIVIAVSAILKEGVNSVLTLVVSGVDIISSAATRAGFPVRGNVSAIIPPGAEYRVKGEDVSVVQQWVELA
ncbi:phage tail protein [Providencia sp. PROV200]|uniref:phage tail-collar fiber domain-containing protein n=1 Tax=Providencia sp. PROV200 TaxID=2936794 RepID=UPI003CF363C8